MPAVVGECLRLPPVLKLLVCTIGFVLPEKGRHDNDRAVTVRDLGHNMTNRALAAVGSAQSMLLLLRIYRAGVRIIGWKNGRSCGTIQKNATPFG